MSWSKEEIRESLPKMAEVSKSLLKKYRWDGLDQREYIDNWGDKVSKDNYRSWVKQFWSHIELSEWIGEYLDDSEWVIPNWWKLLLCLWALFEWPSRICWKRKENRAVELRRNNYWKETVRGTSHSIE